MDTSNIYFVSGDGLIKLPFNVSKIRMRPSYRAKWLQLILVAIIITIPLCRAELTPMTRRWETADLIIEGKIIETRTREGVPESTINVERILKTDSQTVNPLYSKGHVEGLSIKVPANTSSNTFTVPRTNRYRIQSLIL